MTLLGVAVDGPTAAGKGTLARRLADHYGLAYLDTGSLYRKVAYLTLTAGGDPENPDDALRNARRLADHAVEDALLRTPEVGVASSKVGAHPVVREALFDYQRAFIQGPPDLEAGQAAQGAVLDGRDIGTVVWPDAPVKLFVTAEAEARARRRFEEFQAKGSPMSFEEVLQDLMARDERDRTRTEAPLKPAEDAVLLDTTDLSIEAAFEAACAIVDAAMR